MRQHLDCSGKGGPVELGFEPVFASFLSVAAIARDGEVSRTLIEDDSSSGRELEVGDRLEVSSPALWSLGYSIGQGSRVAQNDLPYVAPIVLTEKSAITSGWEEFGLIVLNFFFSFKVLRCGLPSLQPAA